MVEAADDDSDSNPNTAFGRMMAADPELRARCRRVRDELRAAAEKELAPLLGPEQDPFRPSPIL